MEAPASRVGLVQSIEKLQQTHLPRVSQAMEGLFESVAHGLVTDADGAGVEAACRRAEDELALLARFLRDTGLAGLPLAQGLIFVVDAQADTAARLRECQARMRDICARAPVIPVIVIDQRRLGGVDLEQLARIGPQLIERGAGAGGDRGGGGPGRQIASHARITGPKRERRRGRRVHASRARRRSPAP